MDRECLIVGAGHAGVHTAFALRSKGFEGKVTLVGAEEHLPYERPPLSKAALLGERQFSQLLLKKPIAYERSGIGLLLGTRVEQIDREARRVVYADGTSVRYDYLVLATGTRARQLAHAPQGLRVHSLRTLDDASSLQAALLPGTRLLIVGGGYIGLEAASTARKRGCSVTIVETDRGLMRRVVSSATSDYFLARHRAEGVSFLFGVTLTAIEVLDSEVRATVSDGQQLIADHVLVGIGADVEQKIAEDARLEVDNGIVVDQQGRTSDPAIYAVGDAARKVHSLYGDPVRIESIHSAQTHASAVACSITGSAPSVAEAPWFWSNQYDEKLQIVGISRTDDDVIPIGNSSAKRFGTAYVRNGILAAVDLVNSPAEFLLAQRLVAARHAVRPSTRLCKLSDLTT